MTEAEKLTVEQIKATLPRLSAEELEEISTAVVRDASRRLQKDPKK